MAFEPKVLRTTTDFVEHQLAIVGKERGFVHQHYTAMTPNYIGIVPQFIASLEWVEVPRRRGRPSIFVEDEKNVRDSRSYWKLKEGRLYVYGAYAPEGDEAERFVFEYVPHALWLYHKESMDSTRMKAAMEDMLTAAKLERDGARTGQTGVEEIMPGIYAVNLDAGPGALSDILNQVFGEKKGTVQ